MQYPIFFLLFLLSLFVQSCQKDAADEAHARLIEKQAEPLFEAYLADRTGLNFNTGGELLYPGDNTGLLSNVSGVAAGDINNDGLPDLLFSGGRGNSGLFLNEGNFKFRDITRSAGLIDARRNNADNEGVNMVDVNGDGWLDIYILKTGLTGNFKKQEFNSDGANLLFINQKDNTFKEQAQQYGLDLVGLSHTANFFDYDADGDLDVYMGYTAEPGAAFSFPYYNSPPRSRWLNDQFLENVNGRFVDVRQKAGLPYERNVALSVSIGDVNNDGFGDIYVANDFFGRDFFFLNNGDKTFSRKLNPYFTKTPMSAMGSDFADINNDGFIDLFTGEMMPHTHARQKLNLVPFSIEIYNKLIAEGMPQYTRNMLQLNQQGQYFRDIGMLAGVYATEWSWSSFFFDADNDGYKDLYVANGILRDMTNMDFVKKNFGNDYTTMADPEKKAQVNTASAPVAKHANFVFRNRGDYSFEPMSAAWGMGQALQTRGATYADLDADGDLDIILNNMDESPLLYRNQSDKQGANNYLRLRLVGAGKNTFGIGAKAEVFVQGQYQMSYLSNQRGYQSCPEPLLHLGLGDADAVDSLIITWPGGQRERFTGVSAGQVLEIRQGSGQLDKYQPIAKSKYFEAQNVGIIFQHREKPFTDFRSQRLLIRGYAQEGPGVAVADVNGDGLDDCYIGGAAGQSGQLFLQTAANSFEKAPSQPWPANGEDMAAVFFDANGDAAPDLFVASGSNELANDASALKDRLYLNDGSGNYSVSNSIPLSPEMFSCAATAADFDFDGDQDLFVGGRLTAGNYSAVPASLLLRNDNGQFVDVTTDLAADLHRAGRITSAIWTDADANGELDLAVVGEWMPFTIFYQKQGEFTRKIVEGSEGWWNSLIGADIDNDGDTDYIAGNHGLNSIFKASTKEPLTLLTGDFDSNGQMDPVVFKFTDGVNAPFVNRDIFTSQMPAFNNRFYSFDQYAKADISNLFDSQQLEQANEAYAYELRSGVFVNQGNGRFDWMALPIEAQMAPVYGLLPLDINQDGLLDILLGGNTSTNHYEYGSIDAMPSLLLLGQGNGQFEVQQPSTSGLELGGNIRSMAYYLDAQKQLHILLAQNNAAAKVLKYRQAVEAIAIPPQATHALLDLKDGQKRREEFYQGSGYISQSGRFVFKTDAVERITFFKGKEKLK